MALFSSSPRATKPRTLAALLTHSGGVMALIILLVATGAGVTFALWNASVTTGSTAKAGQLSVSASFGGLSGFQFRNHVPTANGTITVTNTTVGKTSLMDVSSQLSATVSGTGVDSTWGSRFTARIWPQSDAACTTATPPASAKQGTLLSIAPITAKIAPGQSVVYCVRITAAAHGVIGVTGGSLSITPKITSTLSYGNGSSWTAATAPTISQSSAGIYPIAAPSTTNWFRISSVATTSGGICVDVDSANDTDGEAVIAYACKDNSDSGKTNQRWRFAADGAYYRITTKLPSARAVAVAGSSTASGAGVVITSASSDSALWQVQAISANSFQLVNKNSGLCLTRGTANAGVTPYTQTACAGSAAQTHYITADGAAFANPIAVPTAQFSCVQDGDDIEIRWGVNTGVPYTVTRSLNATGTNPTTIATNVTGSGYTVEANADWNNAVHYIRVSDGTSHKQFAVTKDTYSNWIWPFTHHRLTCGADAARPAPTPVATKTATITQDSGYYLTLTWPAQKVGVVTPYAMKVGGQQLNLTVANWGSTDALQIAAADMRTFPVGDTVLEIYDGTTLVISQPITITTNANSTDNRLVFAR